MSKRYEVVTGCNYPGPDGLDVRSEPGEFVEGLAPGVEAALLKLGAIATDGNVAGGIVPASPDGIAVTVAGGPVEPFHARDGKAHHTRTDCHIGNNVEPDTRLAGTGDLKLCKECARLARGEA